MKLPHDKYTLVIASEAKQSSDTRLDCFTAFGGSQ
jgi:hypothetical protein